MTVAEVMRDHPATRSAFGPSSTLAMRGPSNQLPPHSQGLPAPRSQDAPSSSLSLPPIREALSFYYSGPSDSTAASSRAPSVPSAPRMSHSPYTANETLASARDNTYVLSNDNEREMRMPFTYGNAEREREERYSQIPRGYSSSIPYINDHHRAEHSGMAEGGVTGSIGSSPQSSPAYSNMADGEAWSTSRRYTDSAAHYAGSDRPSFAGPPHMMDTDHPHHHHHQQHTQHSQHSHSFSGGSGPYQQHPTRTQSLSGGSIHGFDRAAFPPSGPSSGAGMPYDNRHPSRSSSSYPRHHHQQDCYGNNNEFRGRGITMPGSANNGRLGDRLDNKTRKRRGNLPKETTEKLRAWFLTHLNHPYPSEDEKQELIQKTGLQMNQISNWFINARRRQLPGLLNDARATDAMSNGQDGSSGMSGNMNDSRSMSPGGGRRRGYNMPSGERMFESPERHYSSSYDRQLEPRPSSMNNSNDRNHMDRHHHASPHSDYGY